MMFVVVEEAGPGAFEIEETLRPMMTQKRRQGVQSSRGDRPGMVPTRS